MKSSKNSIRSELVYSWKPFSTGFLLLVLLVAGLLLSSCMPKSHDSSIGPVQIQSLTRATSGVPFASPTHSAPHEELTIITPEREIDELTIPISGRIAYVQSADGTDDIFSIDIDGSNLVELTNEGWFNSSPAFSPDGTLLVYASDRAGFRGMFDLYIFDIDHSGLIRLTDEPNAWEIDPSWSPDGKRIAFAMRVFNENDNSDIFISNDDWSQTINLTASIGKEEKPTWSPDGNKIAYLCTDDDNQTTYHLCLINVDGTDRSILLKSVDQGPVSWSADGVWIAYESIDRQPNELNFVKANGSEQKVIVANGVTNLSQAQFTQQYDVVAFKSVLQGSTGFYLISLHDSTVVHLVSVDGAVYQFDIYLQNW